MELFEDEKYSDKFRLRIRLPRNSRDLLHAANLRHRTDGFTSPPKEGGEAEDFFALKNPTASAGFEPANLGTKGQHATSKPPKPIIYIYVFFFFKFISLCIIIQFKYINQLDATIYPVYYLTFIYSSICFGHPHAHHQELNNCSGSLWFYLRSVVIAVLLVVVGYNRPLTLKSLNKIPSAICWHY